MKPSNCRFCRRSDEIRRLLILFPIFLGTPLFPTWAEESAATDSDYVEKFHQVFQDRQPAPSLEEYASASRYDELYMGKPLMASLQNVSNDQGGMAWGLSYRMSSLNEMFRVTGDTKYLKANIECIRAAMEARDDRVGKPLWTGVLAPAWGSDKYAERGRAVFAVHTGMIVFPMLDTLLLSKENAGFRNELGEDYGTILQCATEALAFHDRQWREGPGQDEGHYIGLDQENVLENKPLPGNRQSAMGRALWVSWKATGNELHRKRAVAIGQYVRKRLTPAPDGAYYWPYWLPEDPVHTPDTRENINGEDTSHAGLTMSFPLMLAQEGVVFTREDKERFGKTVTQGFGRLGGGILFGDITGHPDSSPKLVWGSARWLAFGSEIPEIRERILPFYLKYVGTPGPLDLAFLLKYNK